jgi:alpha-mannosidase
MAQCSAGVATPVPEFSFLRLEGGDLVLSAMKVADREDSLVVRVCNPTTRTARGAVVLANAVASARTANLNEDPQRSVPVTGGNRVQLELAPKKIVTLLLKVKPLD